MYGVLSADNRYLKSDWEAGDPGRAKPWSCRGWRHEPQNNVWDSTYVTWKREEIDAARKAGYKIVLDLGLRENAPELGFKISPPDEGPVGQFLRQTRLNVDIQLPGPGTR